MLLLVGCSHPAAPATAHKTVGDLVVTFTSDPPPHTGDNMFTVTLADAGTQTPIGSANLSATPEMLSHVGTGSQTSGRASGGGLYKVPVRLGVATRYDIALHVERAGKPAADVSFPIEAAR